MNRDRAQDIAWFMQEFEMMVSPYLEETDRMRVKGLERCFSVYRLILKGEAEDSSEPLVFED